MGLFDKLSTASGRAFGHLGTAIKKFGHFGGKAVKVVGDIGNGVAGVYNKANGYTNGALGEMLNGVPVVGPGIKVAGKALRFYNQKVAPQIGNVQKDLDQLGNKVGAYHP